MREQGRDRDLATDKCLRAARLSASIGLELSDLA